MVVRIPVPAYLHKVYKANLSEDLGYINTSEN